MVEKYRPGLGDERWPFVTHFVGCKPWHGSSGDYAAERCAKQMERAYNLADNQVLEGYGYVHPNLQTVSVEKVEKVEGCDGSILLKISSGTELDDPANGSIRKVALDLIDDAKANIEKACPGVVSCSDIVVLAGRESVKQTGGPAFSVPLGRRDSFTFSPSTNDLPPPIFSFQQQLDSFQKKNLDATDLVALSGAHTLGVAQCGSFSNRLRPSVDPKLNKDYAKFLINTCPTDSTAKTTALDFFTPNKFDNIYYKNFATGGTLLTSDQNLDQNAQALNLVRFYASNQTAFFNQFLWSYMKMSQIGPKFNNDGEIRKKCTTTNSGRIFPTENSEEIISMVVDGRDSM
ncbi:hypothetical protein R1sor_003766 [Riccia sorocarpa]|uniref:Peroxidase n=1 Tax=Riccia sorocarpa TaxID=122646 RepID=A0ABD3H8Q2_9MARC